MLVSALATAPNTCRPPLAVSTLPTRTSIVTFALFAAADERRVPADSDRCCCRSCWLVRGCISKLLADPQRMVAQCLRAPTGVSRQQVLQYASGDAIGHQGGQMSLQLVQRRCRSAARWPTNARLDAIAGGASKPGKRHRHPAKQRRDVVSPPVLTGGIFRCWPSSMAAAALG